MCPVGAQVGLVGVAAWGRLILRDLVVLGCEVTAMVRNESRRRYALENGAVRVVERIEDLPGNLAGLVVATPTSTHAEVAEAVLDRNVPIYVEKPLTNDVAAAALIADRAGDRVFVMHKWRYHPGVQLLGESRSLGRARPGRRPENGTGGLGNPHPDVDAVWILAPHDVSIALEVLGTIPEPRSVVAEATCGRVSGLVGLLGDDPWFAFDVSTAHPVRRREIRLVCRDGVATLPDPYADHVLMSRGEILGEVTLEEEKRPISTEFPLLRELRAFAEHLDGGPAPKSSAAEGAAEVATVARLRELAGLDPT
jgi:predicted dehydrogenase